MARIAGVDLPRDKRVEFALPYIFGIGVTLSRKILNEAGVSFDTLRLEVPRAPRDAAELRRARFEIDQLQADAYPLDPSAPIWRFWWD